MGGFLVLIFIVVPILEIMVFIQAGNLIGLWPTVAGVVLTAIIGAAVVRHQGLATLASAQQSLVNGQFPVREVFDGLCLVIAGALLITPGFLTDTTGFLLLVPPVRTYLRRIVGARMMASGRVTIWSDAPAKNSPPRRDPGTIIIDAEYKHVPDRPEQPPGGGSAYPQASDENRQGEHKDPSANSPWRKDGETNRR